jgi:tryptophan synthase alpha chain
VASAGIDSLLVVDLPTDEAGSLRAAAAQRGVGLVPLVAPTTKEVRIARITAVAKQWPVPFVYYVSMTGVAGGAGAHDVLADAATQAAKVREITGRPTVVGFGIDSAERARVAATGADGVVVGSAIVRRIEEGTSAAARLAAVRALVASLRAAI